MLDSTRTGTLVNSSVIAVTMKKTPKVVTTAEPEVVIADVSPKHQLLGDYKGDDYNMVINSLKLMFPTHPECYLQQVVKDSVDLKDAADMILCDDKGE